MLIEWGNGGAALEGIAAEALLERFGSPLYVYSEKTLRKNCRKLRGFCSASGCHVNYSAKANSNVALLKIIRSEGIKVDAMSLGELFLEEEAGFAAEEILFLTNNASEETFRIVGKKGLRVCLDSLGQLEGYCRLNPGSEVYLRLNVGKGAGHHPKVVTVGKVKFGVDQVLLPEAFRIAAERGCAITGFTVHAGSLFADAEAFHANVLTLLDIAEEHPGVRYLDFGGGFAVAYDRGKDKVFPFDAYEPEFSATLNGWRKKRATETVFAIEPGRFPVAEAGVCLTRAMSVKTNRGVDFVGCDMGFNFLLRPALYDSYHEILNATRQGQSLKKFEVTGNLCESGDILGKDRLLPADTKEGDVLLIRDTGAYGFSMAGNFNGFGRPAEALIDLSGEVSLIRRREPLERLAELQVY